MKLDRKYVEQVLDALHEDSKPLWGIMTAQHLLEHFIYLFRMSIGEKIEDTVTPEEKRSRYQQSLHNERRFPKFFKSPYLKVDTVESLEFLSFNEAKEALKNYWDKYDAYYLENPEARNSHVIYGSLDKTHWDFVQQKHFEHHFRQFDLKKTIKEGYVDKHIDKSGIGWIEFYHPSHNSLPSNLLQQIVDYINFYSGHKDCSIIVLKSGGDRTFCAGASFDELKTISNEQEGAQFFSGFAHVLNAIRNSEKLVIGRVQGKAVGGGVGIASAVDYCFATKYASIKLSELGIGIGPFVIGPAVERKIGLTAFSQLALDFDHFYDCQWAHAKGMYQQTFESVEEMDEAISEFAQKLTKTNPQARLEMKKMLWKGTENWPKEMEERAKVSGRLILSDFAKNALT